MGARPAAAIPPWDRILIPDKGNPTMAATGVTPKNTKHGRTGNLDWTDVPDQPFHAGCERELPQLGNRKKWHPEVLRWWETLRVMPHACLFEESDWVYAIETAYIRQAHYVTMSAGQLNTTTAVELRRRDDVLGTTAEARRKNRIRYIDPARYHAMYGDLNAGPPKAGMPAGVGGATVTPITSSRRARALEADAG